MRQAIDLVQAARAGDLVAIAGCLEREREEERLGTYDDLPQRGRQAKIRELQGQVHVLTARLQARDDLIRRQRGRIQQLQKLLVQRSRTAIVAPAIKMEGGKA